MVSPHGHVTVERQVTGEGHGEKTAPLKPANRKSPSFPPLQAYFESPRPPLNGYRGPYFPPRGQRSCFCLLRRVCCAVFRPSPSLVTVLAYRSSHIPGPPPPIIGSSLPGAPIRSTVSRKRATSASFSPICEPPARRADAVILRRSRKHISVGEECLQKPAASRLGAGTTEGKNRRRTNKRVSSSSQVQWQLGLNTGTVTHSTKAQIPPRIFPGSCFGQQADGEEREEGGTGTNDPQVRGGEARGKRKGLFRIPRGIGLRGSLLRCDFP